LSLVIYFVISDVYICLPIARSKIDGFLISLNNVKVYSISASRYSCLSLYLCDLSLLEISYIFM
jgi:hypothetical protein